MTKPIPPWETEKIWHGSSDPQNVLQLHHREHGCITAWYGNCSASDRKALQRVVLMAKYITGAKLPVIQDLYTRRCQRKARKIVKDSSQPSHRLFSLLPHDKRYRSAKSRSKRLLNSFYPQAIRLLFYTAAILCLLSMHSHFNSTYMYVHITSITSTNRCPRTLTLYRYPLYIVSLFNYL